MSRRYGRLVDGIWIQKRMNEKDARRQLELQRRQPVVDVVLIPKPETSTAAVVDVAIEPKSVSQTSQTRNPYYDFPDDLRPNATCADCGTDYSKAEDDPTPCCDACSDRRDRWAEAYKLRRMLRPLYRWELPGEVRAVLTAYRRVLVVSGHASSSRLT